MKKLKPLSLISLILTITLILSFSSVALAMEFEDFTDVTGHWAEETLKKSFADGLLTGFEDSTLRPDSPITLAQILTILTRVLNATEMGDPSASDIPADLWYSNVVAKALYLGIISPSVTNFNGESTRQDAMSIMSKAFSLTPAQPDLSVLNAFSDAAAITAANRPAMAALVSSGLVQGFNNTLNVNSSITRAEFLTVLYRVVSNYVQPSAFSGSLSGGSLIKGSGSLTWISTAESLWFDCAAESVSLSGVTAKNLTLRSNKLSSLSISGGTKLDRLVVDSGSYSISLPASGAEIGTLQLAGKGTAAVAEGTQNIEITGSGITLNLRGTHENLIISGNNNLLLIDADTTIKNLTITGSGNSIRRGSAPAVFAMEAINISGNKNIMDSEAGFISAKSISLSGSENKVSFTAPEKCNNIEISGNLNGLTFAPASTAAPQDQLSEAPATEKSGADVGLVKISGGSNWVSLACNNLDSLTVSGSYNSVFGSAKGTITSLYQSGSNNALQTTGALENAEVSAPNSKLTVNGTAGHILITGSNCNIDGTGLAQLITVKSSSCTVTLKSTTLDQDYLTDVNRVLKLVTSPYKGNYTLKYAQEHDYEDFEKEIFVNAKGYSSRTDYLIWINIATQRTSIFTGSQGSWKLVRSSIVATGAPGSATPVGVWFTTYKQQAGWTTSTYTCRPVVRFKPNTGYAFHSRLYYPNSNKLTDASIGYPVSAGCIRMYDEDIQYIFDNIPANTTVVVF